MQKHEGELRSLPKRPWNLIVSGCVVILVLLTGCGVGGGDSNSSNTSNAATNLAILRPEVKVINQTEASFTESQTLDQWVLRSPFDAHAGDVLLLDDAAIRVIDGTVENGKTVLTVSLVGIEDVFSKLTIQQDVDLNSAVSLPEPGNEDGSLQTTSPALAAVFSGSKSYVDTIKEGPFSGKIALDLLAKLDFSYDEKQNVAPRGMLDVTAKTSASISASLASKATFRLPEKKLTTLRIPISYTLVDAALRFLDVRLASIQIPVTLGLEASTNVAIGVELAGSTTTQVVVRYDKANGLAPVTPITTNAFAVTGTLPNEIPGTAATGALRAGPYLRARPALVILNKVRTIGVDMKAGLYANGEVTAFLTYPYYCLKAQAALAGEIFGFFTGIGDTKPFSVSQDIGPLYVRGQCTPDQRTNREIITGVWSGLYTRSGPVLQGGCLPVSELGTLEFTLGSESENTFYGEGTIAGIKGSGWIPNPITGELECKELPPLSVPAAFFGTILRNPTSININGTLEFFGNFSEPCPDCPGGVLIYTIDGAEDFTAIISDNLMSGKWVPNQTTTGGGFDLFKK